MNLGLDIITVLTGVVSAATAVLGVWLKVKYDEKKHKQLNYDPQLHSNVITALEYIKEETEADRVSILEFHNGEHYEKSFGMNGALLEKAEPVKTKDKGFCASEVLETAREIGFTECNVEYEWFLGQAKVMHEQSSDDASIIEQYLNMVLPVSTHLFKYLRFIFVK